MARQESRLYEFGPYRLIPAERLLLCDGVAVALPPKAFDTLLALVGRAGSLVEKDELLNEVWAGTNVEEAIIAQNVHMLRRTLGRRADGKQYIETVPKRGYRFLEGVKVVEGNGGGGRPPAVQEAAPAAHVVEAMADAERAIPAAHAALAVGDFAANHAHVAAQVSPGAADRSPRAGGGRAVELDGRQLATAADTPQAAAIRPRAGRGGALKSGPLAASLAAALALVGVGVVVARLYLSRPAPAATAPLKLSRLMSGAKIWSAAVSPDGRHVAHVVEHAGQTSIWVRQVATTADLHIIPPERAAVYWGLSFSRDGDYLFYVKHVAGAGPPTLYRVPALGGASRKVADDVHSPAATSPDGRSLAFVRVSGEETSLVVADADGGGERRLGVRRSPQEAFSGSPRGGPAWSPDGRMIATGVISLDGGYHGEVVVVSVADGGERRLTSRRWYQVAQVAWLADGGGLLAAAREEWGGAQIWHVSYPEGEARRITNDLSDYHGLSLTADSRTLATVQYDRPSTIEFEPGKPPAASQRVTAGMNEGFYGISWMPDGRVAYAAEVSGNLDIWLAGADGASAERLTTDPHADTTPSVSPDGRSVAFISPREGGIPHVWLMDIDGGNQRRLSSHGMTGTPSFTPDGRWVVYAAAGSGIWKVPVEGGAPLPIYEGRVHTPSVSPDGSLVACFYEDEKTGVAKMALLRMEGGPPVKILDLPPEMMGPTLAWTPDARALIYGARRDGVSNLWTLPLDGSRPRALTDFTSGLIFNFAWSRDRKQLALARGSVVEHVVLISDFE